MIEGLFEVGSLVMLFGPSGNYKSFLSLDWMLCMATGRKWHGKSVLPAKVLYALGEGKASLLKRIQAWTYHHQISQAEGDRLQENFRVTFEVPQLAQGHSVTNLINDLKESGFTPNVIVIDTFARSAVGLDEKDANDTGKWIEQADRLRQLGLTVLFLHHTSKGSETDKEGNQSLYPKYRGSTAIKAAMDSAFALVQDKRSKKVILRVDKQKDHDEGEPTYFNVLKVLPPGHKIEEESVVLIPSPNIDEGFTLEGQAIESAIKDLMNDTQYESDRARARELSRLHPTLTEAAAQTRVASFRKRFKEALQPPPTVN